MSKKLIIIAAAGGLLTFAAAFFGARMLGRSPATVENAANTKAKTRPAAPAGQPQAEGSKAATEDSQTKAEENTEAAKGLTQKELKNLIYEVREKISSYENKEKEMALREARLQMTQETLKKDIDTLNQLKVELATMTANLKEQKNQLLETRTKIAKNEKVNLTSIALTYDKMDPAGATSARRAQALPGGQAGHQQ